MQKGGENVKKSLTILPQNCYLRGYLLSQNVINKITGYTLKSQIKQIITYPTHTDLFRFQIS